MPRAVPIWTGKTDDVAIPTGVQLRIWNRAKGHCQICTRLIMAGEVKHFDHVKPLADGGRHAENNLQIACVDCHKAKSAGEATERAKVRAVAKSVLGIRTAPARPLNGGAFPKSIKSARREARASSKLPVPGASEIARRVRVQNGE